MLGKKKSGLDKIKPKSWTWNGNVEVIGDIGKRSFGGMVRMQAWLEWIQEKERNGTRDSKF